MVELSQGSSCHKGQVVTRVNLSLSSCLMTMTIKCIVCVVHALNGLYITQVENMFSLKRPVLTGRKGQIRVMSVNEMLHNSRYLR